MRKETIIFIVSFIIISFCYNYHNILFKENSSIHQWRQADCLSITQNFYKENLPIHKPKIHHIGDEIGKRGVASEFPIIYYVVGNIWKITGRSEAIFRGINLIITFLGLLYLFRLFFKQFNKLIPSLFLAFLIFTSPIYVFYSNNFLADASALSIVFIGWYHFYNYYKNKGEKYLVYCLLLFLFAGLLKVSSLLSFFAIGGVFLFELISPFKGRENEKLFKRYQIGYFILVFVIIASWYSYAIWYSESEKNTYVFLKSILPIWELGPERISETFSKFFSIQVPRIFNSGIHISTLLIFVFNMFNFNRINKFLSTVNLLLFIGVICFFLLFYQVFDIHDYYLINTLIFYLFTWFNFFTFLQKHTKWFSSIIFKSITAAALLFLVFISSVHIRHRYDVNDVIAQAGLDYISKHDKKVLGWYQFDYDKNMKAFNTITPYLRELGINREDVVMVLGDQSINISLYNMDQIGFTNYCDVREYPNQVELAKSFGAKYLFISEYKVLDFPQYQPYMNNKIGKYKNILIFRIPGT